MLAEIPVGENHTICVVTPQIRTTYVCGRVVTSTRTTRYVVVRVVVRRIVCTTCVYASVAAKPVVVLQFRSSTSYAVKMLTIFNPMTFFVGGLYLNFMRMFILYVTCFVELY